MDQRGKNKLKMYKAVEAICTAYQAAWSNLPAFASRYTQFSAHLHDLEQAAYRQDIAMAGVAASRDQLLDATIELAEIIANALRSYAAATHNALLEGQLDFPKSEFRTAGQQLILQRIDRVLASGNDHLSALGDYGIVQSDLDNLAALRQQLGETIGTPRNAIIDRKQETQAIADLIDALDDVLRDHLDRLVEVLKPAHPDFYGRYKTARIIVDYKGKKHDAHGPEGDGNAE